MDPFDLVLLALATWRVSHMLSIEEGPGQAFKRIRVRAGAYETIHAGWQAETCLGKLLICPLCVSVWVTPALYVVFLWLPWLWFVVVVLAISGLAALLQLIADR